MPNTVHLIPMKHHFFQNGVRNVERKIVLCKYFYDFTIIGTRDYWVSSSWIWGNMLQLQVPSHFLVDSKWKYSLLKFKFIKSKWIKVLQKVMIPLYHSSSLGIYLNISQWVHSFVRFTIKYLVEKKMFLFATLFLLVLDFFLVFQIQLNLVDLR